jgi:hypothetical protein
MSAHASFAPSSAARWLECPASALLGATLPRSDSEASLEGTRIHALIESAIGGNPVHQEEPEDVAYGIELVLDYVRQLGGPESVMAERRVVISDEVWGTVDILQPHHYVTTIGDYKNGQMDVEADRNKQLLTYAVGALEEFGPSKFYRLVIVQPNSRTAGDKPDVKQSIATLEEVEQHREAVDRHARGGGAAPREGAGGRQARPRR